MVGGVDDDVMGGVGAGRINLGSCNKRLNYERREGERREGGRAGGRGFLYSNLIGKRCLSCLLDRHEHLLQLLSEEGRDGGAAGQDTLCLSR